MTKSELKTGMILTTRNGEDFVLLHNFYCIAQNPINCLVSQYGQWMNLNEYDDDLIHTSMIEELDIMSVKIIYHPHKLFRDKWEDIKTETIWERNPPKKMTVSEIESILGYKIEIIAEKENYYD